ncbi:hypothetical protein ASPZODRAFT_1614430 [Penicilliopsis zonata CBS 506.65]|uniref:HDA1 complex subunit n=1 Tax=Penicilliopsis zonata CBS 506.65 TaxID=1073090 RepID=A0A1L9SN45_9EURO|nr:hypothetical protein ASPZODRAFT_1614430 [Penicilliopsis zonata CBS 506.65]OJJ48521.1 hypothetical protein ASPZODRAFT_1614430 [Penicilliopsis zonata CBS 506.65]
MDDQDKKILSPAEAMQKWSHFQGSTPKEKLENAYAQMRAKQKSTPASASATPSSAGDIEASPLIPVPDKVEPLSIRVDKEPVTHATHQETHHHHHTATAEPFGPPVHGTHEEHPVIQTIQPSALTVRHDEEPVPGSVQLGPSEFAITVPMDCRVKGDYERIIMDETRAIQEFLGSFGSTAQSLESERERLSAKMYKMVDKLNNVTTHPDINYADELKDVETSPDKEASWGEYSSAKFLLLGYLTRAGVNSDIHLVIMVQEGKSVNIMERYLLGKGFSYTRPREEMGSGTNLELSMRKGSLSMGIQPTQSDGIMEAYRPPSAIIALDASFNIKSPSVEHMRTTYARHSNLLPVIRLVVASTAEHISLCLPNIPEIERLRFLVQYTLRLRDVVGELQDDALGVQEDAEEILAYLLSDDFHTIWPLPVIEPLQIASPAELESLIQVPSPADLPAVSAVNKRLFEVEESDEPMTKRQRMVASQDQSQLTESSGAFPSQPLGVELQAFEHNLMQMRTSHAAEMEKLKESLSDASVRLEAKEEAMASLQHRYESRALEMRKLRKENEGLISGKANLEQRFERQKEDNAKLRDERTQLKEELKTAREALQNGDSSMSDLESVRAEVRRLNEKNAGLERKAEYEKKQAEYTREQYQTANNVVGQLRSEVGQLRDENETLKRKASGDAIRLKELNLKTDEARYLLRIAELEATLTAREDLLRRKEDELRELKKNRPSTRSTSTQPRSPKWASASRPTSPGINNGNNGSGVPGRGSGLRFSSEMSL